MALPLLQAPTGALQLKITGMRDRAHVIVNNKLTGIIDYHSPEAPLQLPVPPQLETGPAPVNPATDLRVCYIVVLGVVRY